MSRVICRRGVTRGVQSRGFSVLQLLDALKGNTEQVYVELDSGGRLTAARGCDVAALCVCARLAPHVLGAGALLTLSGAELCLRAVAELAPHAELQLWFAEDALAALDMPFLTLRNIRGRRDYVCHHCGATFDDPNPLKVHLFLACAPHEPRAFWREAAARLARAAAAAAPTVLLPAQLEALAAAWGGVRGGHVCVYCGKLYSRRYGLKIHLRTHTGYRPLRCRHCQRAFGDPSNLNKHERLHVVRDSREPSTPHHYRCDHCGRALARRRDLERHRRTHTHTHTHAHTHSGIRDQQ